MEDERIGKLDYYLSNLIAETVRPHVKNPERVNWKNYLAKWVPAKKTRITKTPMEVSKAFWCGGVGITERT